MAPARHQAGDEGDIPREPIQFGDKHRALLLACRRKCCGELRSAIERIGALAAFDLRELRQDGYAFGYGETRHGCSLGFQPQTRPPLPLG
jgi:hypothetical protein